MKRLPLAASALALATFGWGCAKPAAVPEKTEPAQQQAEQKPAAQPSATSTAPMATTTKPTTTTNTAPTAKPTPKPTPKPATKPTPAYQVVSITANGFTPQIIAVFEGDGVTWINKDGTSHNTRSDNALLWDSGNIAAGGRYSHVFPAAGSYAYTDGSTGKHGTVVVNQRPK